MKKSSIILFTMAFCFLLCGTSLAANSEDVSDSTDKTAVIAYSNDTLINQLKAEIATLNARLTKLENDKTISTPTPANNPPAKPEAVSDRCSITGWFKYDYRRNNDKAFSKPVSYLSEISTMVTAKYKVDEKHTFFGTISGANDTGVTSRDRVANNFKLNRYGFINKLDNGWNLTAGRTGVMLGAGGVLFTGITGGPATYFDGVVLTNKLGNVNVKAAFGQTTPTANGIDPKARWVGADFNTDLSKDVNSGLVLASRHWLGAPSAGTNLGTFYWSPYARVKINDKLRLNAEFIKSNADSENTAYDFGAIYSFDEKNSFQILRNYVELNSIDPDSTTIGTDFFPNYHGFTADSREANGKYANGYKGCYFHFNHKFDKVTDISFDYYHLRPLNNHTYDGEFETYVMWYF